MQRHHRLQHSYSIRLLGLAKFHTIGESRYREGKLFCQRRQCRLESFHRQACNQASDNMVPVYGQRSQHLAKVSEPLGRLYRTHVILLGEEDVFLPRFCRFIDDVSLQSTPYALSLAFGMHAKASASILAQTEVFAIQLLEFYPCSGQLLHWE